MKTTITRHLESPFRITGAHIRSLFEFLTQNVGPTQITAKCADHAQREFETVEELMAFENVDSQKLHELMIHAKSDEPGALRVSLDLSSGGTGYLFQLNNIYVYISGANDQTVYLSRELENKIEMMKPWYSKYTKLQGYHALLFLMLVVWGGTSVVALYTIAEYNIITKTEGAR